MPPWIYFLIVGGWIVWMAPFLFQARRSTKAQKIDPRARWGMLLQSLGYMLLWQGKFWLHPPSPGRIVSACVFLIAASLLSWLSVRELGRQWRVDAGLNADHRLIRSGPYALVRHPIYTSMFCMLLATGLLVCPWWLFLAATAVFLVGTRIRMGVENQLLEKHFGEAFHQYRQTTGGLLPFLRWG